MRFLDGCGARWLAIGVAAMLSIVATALAGVVFAPRITFPGTAAPAGAGKAQRCVAARAGSTDGRSSASGRRHAVRRIGPALAKLHVDYGDDVKAGQLLPRLVPAHLKARLEEARADLETARRDALAATSLADEACVLADVVARQSRRKTELLGRASRRRGKREGQGDADAGAASCAARRAAARVSEWHRVPRARFPVRGRDRALLHSCPFPGRVLECSPVR